MRSYGRIVLASVAITLGIAASGLLAQDPNAAPTPNPIPVVTPVPVDSPEPVDETVTAPADELPSVAQDDASGAPAAASVGDASSDLPTSSGLQGSALAAVDVASLLPSPPPAPAVDAAAGYSRAVDEKPPQGQRASDWIFLGIVALAMIVIIARLTRGQPERLSIQANGGIRGIPPPSVPSPPVVRQS